MTYKSFEDLPVWKVAVELAVRVFALTSAPEIKGLGDMKSQMERAALSVSNNIAEGFERGTTNELLRFIYIARGSAGEVRSMTHVLEAVPVMSSHLAAVNDIRGRATNIARQLRGWADNLQNSDIKGQRYLTDDVKQKAQHERDWADFDAEMQRYAEQREEILRERQTRAAQKNVAPKSSQPLTAGAPPAQLDK